jgi:nucleoside 2-deoxyribosyltransferase
MILGWWTSAAGSLLFRHTIAWEGIRFSTRRQALAPLACLLVLTLLAVYPLAVLLTDSMTGARTWAILMAAALGFLLSNLLRGFFEPHARTTLLRFSREGGFSLPTSLISAFNIAQRAANFAGALVFALFLPHVGSVDLNPADVAQRQDYIAHALLYTLVVVAMVIMAGILFAQIYPQIQARKEKTMCVVVGSYQQDFDDIMQFSAELRRRGYNVLYPPPEAEVVATEGGFVRCNVDISEDEGEIQWYVFRLIDRADLLVVFTRDGRVGTSAAMEVGYALRAGKPVYTLAEPNDRTILRLTKHFAKDTSPQDMIRKGGESRE